MKTYQELINDYKYKPVNPEQYAGVDIRVYALADWFMAYGNKYWNGEYYDVKELNARLYPIYSTFPNDWGGYDIVAWELR